MRWEEVVAALRVRRLVVIEKDHWLGLAWRLGGEVQRQRVELVQPPGRGWIAVACEVLPLVQLSPVAILRYNAGLLCGSLAVEGPTCILRYVLRLEELTVPLLVRSLVTCAHEASRLRKLRRDAASPTPHVVD